MIKCCRISSQIIKKIFRNIFLKKKESLDFQSILFTDFLETPIPAEFKIVRTRGVNSVILVDDSGFSYSSRSTKNSSNSKNNFKTWRCSKKNKQCKAYIITENSWIIAQRNSHNHEPPTGYPGEINIRSLDPGDYSSSMQDFFSQNFRH